MAFADPWTVGFSTSSQLAAARRSSSCAWVSEKWPRPRAELSLMVSFDRPGEAPDFMLGAIPLRSLPMPLKKVSRMSRCRCTSLVRADHAPVGVSGHVRIMTNAVKVMRMNGTTNATRHATWSVRCWCWTRELKMAGMTK